MENITEELHNLLLANYY